MMEFKVFNQQITRRFLTALDHIEYGEIKVTTPDGCMHGFKGPASGAAADLVIHDWRFARALLQHGDIALAEAYRDGWWDSSDPAQLFLFGLQNQSSLDGYIYGSAFGRLASRIAYLFTRNTLKRSKKNPIPVTM